MFANLLIILASSLVVIALFQRLRLPPVLGYLCVGLMIGPTAFNWVNESEELPDLAELGVVFLLFSLGLEFSLSKMLALRQVVFGLGGLQVLVTAAAAGGLLMLFGMPMTPALLLGAGLALSSTAIVSKELGSLGEIFSSHGQNAIAVLLFQDVVAVLLLTLVPVFAGSSDQAWYWALPLTLGKTVVLFVGLLMASRWLLPRLFHEVAAARSAELFVLLALVIVLLTAWLTHLLGLSPALGAFLAGMLLGESHYRHQIEADIRPFRDILLGVFFVSIGMLIDLQSVRQPRPADPRSDPGFAADQRLRGRAAGQMARQRWRNRLAQWPGVGPGRRVLLCADGADATKQHDARRLRRTAAGRDLLLDAADATAAARRPASPRACTASPMKKPTRGNQRAQCRIAQSRGDLWLRSRRSVHRASLRNARSPILRWTPIRCGSRKPPSGETCVHYGDSRRGELLVRSDWRAPGCW